MLKAFNFAAAFLKQIMACLTGSWFSLKVNGSSHGFFKGKSGVRHGDPLSPYIFVLSMEVLSRYLREICQKPQVSMHPKCVGIKLTHLIFADDLMIFSRGDLPSVSPCVQTLEHFGRISRLKANSEKTSIFFGGVHEQVKQAILAYTNFQQEEFPIRYLGVPLNASRLCISNFGMLINKMQHVIHHWSTKFLSYAGKLQLIQSRLDSTGDSFWVQWIKSYSFKGTDVWHTPIKEYFPGSMKGILKTRDACIQIAGGIPQAKLLVQNFINNGKFLFFKSYEIFRTRHREVYLAETISRQLIIPSHRITISLALEKHLPTVDNIIGKGLLLPNRCSLCKAPTESHMHLFFNCIYAKDVWQGMLNLIGINRRGMNLMQQIGWFRSGKHRKHWSSSWFIYTLAATVHFLWHE
ncbi:uncharacterized protein LOC141626279 [Silene latifolia]|uniref:uncharacterized protein LOC141626279 n=1 Tax=Silene latifolia TaxID=37657 RepID=UPI003D781FBE